MRISLVAKRAGCVCVNDRNMETKQLGDGEIWETGCCEKLG